MKKLILTVVSFGALFAVAANATTSDAKSMNLTYHLSFENNTPSPMKLLLAEEKGVESLSGIAVGQAVSFPAQVDATIKNSTTHFDLVFRACEEGALKKARGGYECPADTLYTCRFEASGYGPTGTFTSSSQNNYKCSPVASAGHKSVTYSVG
ncbi:MAG: hypothetical protein CMF50_02400 [Legionellales bacterium]|nr:hypothetical protein [Legionellales bacterium]|tara:strand:+ start:52301 stop:52759 length:459 start_codon:yes stop_codon:yes gene_type:complete